MHPSGSAVGCELWIEDRRSNPRRPCRIHGPNEPARRLFPPGLDGRARWVGKAELIEKDGNSVLQLIDRYAKPSRWLARRG